VGCIYRRWDTTVESWKGINRDVGARVVGLEIATGSPVHR